MRVTRHVKPGSIEQNLPFIAQVIERNLEKGSEDVVVRQVAEQIVKNVRARDHLGEIRAVHDWVKKHVRYTHDPYGVELIKTPRRMLMDYARRRAQGETAVIFADCDESSLLAASLARSLGHRARIVLMDTLPFTREISHAIAQVEYPRGSGRWLFMETVKDKELGWSPRHSRLIPIE